MCNYAKISVVLYGGIWALICYYVAEWLVARDEQYHMDSDGDHGCDNYGVEVLELNTKLDK